MKLIFQFTFLVFLSSCSLTELFTSLKVNPPQNGTSKIDFVVEDLVFIKANVNGIEGLFLFDNGFTNCALNKDFSEKCNVKFTGKKTVSDANNQRITYKDGEIQNLQIGEFNFQNATFHEIETDKFLPCFKFDGVIGGNVINKVNWKFDFTTNQVIMQVEPFKQDGIIWPTSFESSRNSTFVKFYWDETPINVHVDFGKQTEIEFNLDNHKRKLKSFPADLVVGITSLSAAGLGKVDTNYSFPGGKFNFKVNNQSIMPFTEVEFESGAKREGRIGVGYFKRFNQVVFNSTKQEIILQGFNPANDDDFKSYNLAIYPIDGVYKLIQVRPNNPNYQQLNLMDEVVEINNMPTRKFKSVCEYKTFIETQKETQSPLVVKFENIPNYLEFKYQQPFLEYIK